MRVIAAGLLALAGCAGDGVTTLRVDGCDAELAGAVRWAAGEWSLAGVDVRVVPLGAPADWRVVRGGAPDGDRHAAGVCMHRADAVAVRGDVHGEKLRAVLLHEVGHALGLAHRTGPDAGLMRADGGETVGCIDTVSATLAGGVDGTCVSQEAVP